MNRDDLAARVLAAFVDELDEQLRTLNDALLTLERNPADASQLRDVFRVMHTLKGAARAAGVLPVEEACHALESELAAARDSGAPMTGGQISLLFAAADALDEARRALRAGQPVPTATLAMLTRQTRVAAAPRSTSAQGDPQPRRTSQPVVASEILAAAPAAVVPPVAPQPADTERREGPSRDVAANESARPEEQQHLRVAVHRLDAVVATAGEIVGLAGALGDRAGQLASIQQELARLRGDQAMKIARELARVERCAADDARGLDVLSRRLLESVRQLRQRPFGDVTEALPRVVRDVAASGGKQARFVLGGATVEVDRSVLEALREPLTHLVRNAVDHGLETPQVRQRAGKPAEGTITVEATLLGERLRIVVSDDGQGLDLDAIRAALVRRGQAVPKDDRAVAHTMFDEGFSTRREATTISGRGVGLGIVRSAVQRLGGSVDVTWNKGQGTTLTLEVPVSVATVRALVVAVGAHTIALPTTFITRVQRVPRQQLLELDGRAVIRQDGAPVPVVSLARLLGPPFVEGDASTPTFRAVILEVGVARLGIIVDDIVEERELVVRPLEQAAGTIGGFTTGAAPLADGRVMLVLDVPALFAEASRGGSASGPDLAGRKETSDRRTRVLVVDDSITTRALEESVLGAAGYDVVTAVDGLDALRIIEQGDVALVVSDIEMPRMDGIELCMRIRANRQLAELPVILVTSLDDPAHRARGLEAGADAYISKSSFDQDALLETVRQLLGRQAETVQ